MSYSQIKHYKEQSINSMSNGEQIVLLFDEALKNLNYAVLLLQQDDKVNFTKCTEKAKSIFHYLSDILDRQQGLSADLYQMYYFFNSEIIKSEIKQDCEPIKKIIPLVEDLRITWVEANKIVSMKK